MKHIFEQKVYYSDTDAFGVVWHGSYLRWLEMGRVDFCEELGLKMNTLDNMDIALPVTSMNLRYKASAKLNDIVVIETAIKEVTPIRIVFEQTIKNKETNHLYIQAEFAVVAIHKDGKLYRRLPNILSETLQKDKLCYV